jgi:KTSC domain
MKRTSVTSSLIKSIGHENGELHVEFHHGGIYSYMGPKVEEHYNNMLSAPSVGKYFFANIKNCPNTVCRKV